MRSLLSALLSLSLASPILAQPERLKPNIVVIMVDDMGYADLGCYGGEIRTPNIDALAKGGTRWRSFYNCAQCCPTRASLMTGLYPHQAGIGDMIDAHSLSTREAAASPAYSDHLSRNAVTIAEALRPAGYQTYMVGKWHLGKNDGQRPLQRGFDRYYGIISGADSYWKPTSLRDGDAPVKEFPKDFYATDAFTTKAIEFVEKRDPKKPFFLYTAYNAPHTPFHVRSKDLEKYKGEYDAGWDEIREKRFARQKEMGFWPKDLSLPARSDAAARWTGSPEQLAEAERMTKYAGIVDRIDQNVGRLVAALKRSGQLDNTLILFLSDNGAWATPGTYGTEFAETGNTPFRLFKVFVHEGGIRTPLLAHWPGTIPAGVLNTSRYGHVKDIMATCLDAASVNYPKELAGQPIVPLEGQSLLPALKDSKKADNEPLYWERRGHEALRDGPWKIVRFYGAPNKDPKLLSVGPRVGNWELYNLDSDPTESRNLAAEQPTRLAEMVERHAAWANRVGVIPREQLAARIDAAEKK